MSAPASSSGPGASRRARRLLSLFFVLHWGAVAAYLLPATRAALEPVPEVVRPVATLVFPRYVRWTSPVAVPYLNLTATRQHWTLFAPWPADWAASVRVVPYFPMEGAEAWRADTLVVRGSVETAYPHLFHHRTYRVLYNMGYDEWGRRYRGLFAAEMCRVLRSPEGVAPSGVELFTWWEPRFPPWEEWTEEAYLQRMGGYDCPPETRTDEARRPPWPPYGLPVPVEVADWPVVEASTASSDAPERESPPAEGAR